MEFSSDIAAGLVLLLTSSFFLFYYFFHNPKVSKNNAPPEAGGAWPLIGHFHLLTSKLPHITLAAIADKCGPIFTIRLGVRQAVVISSSDLAKEIFIKYDAVVSNRPHLLAHENLGYNLAMFGFSPYGPYWREIRKLISSELLSSRQVQLQMHVFESEIQQSIKEIYNLWEEKRGASERVVVDMTEWFGNMILNVALRMVVGKRFFGPGGRSREEARRCRALMRDFFELGGMFVVGDAVPFLRWLDIGGYEKKMKETSWELDLLVRKWLEEHKQKDEESEQDFMDVMLSTVRGDKLQGYHDDDTIIKSTCSNLISGATDTTAVMLVWTLSLLLNNTETLKKAQQELDTHIGRQRRVKPSDIKNLVYLQAIVKETLRLHPPAPLSGAREFSQDCNIGGYHFPKGTTMLVNLWKLQRDPRVWLEDPSEFRPERFLTTHKDVEVRSRDYEMMPFGGGRRICPGLNFGMQMLHLVLTDFLHAFEVSTPAAAGGVVDMREGKGLTTSKTTPLEVVLAPRLCANLY